MRRILAPIRSRKNRKTTTILQAIRQPDWGLCLCLCLCLCRSLRASPPNLLNRRLSRAAAAPVHPRGAAVRTVVGTLRTLTDHPVGGIVRQHGRLAAGAAAEPGDRRAQRADGLSCRSQPLQQRALRLQLLQQCWWQLDLEQAQVCRGQRGCRHPTHRYCRRSSSPKARPLAHRPGHRLAAQSAHSTQTPSHCHLRCRLAFEIGRSLGWAIAQHAPQRAPRRCGSRLPQRQGSSPKRQ